MEESARFSVLGVISLQRDNFQMEGPIRVMKQLEAMSKILEVTDSDMLKHLVLAGADNFLFAFRMLLVLFRRELSFPEALYMWEVCTFNPYQILQLFQFSAPLLLCNPEPL